MESRNQLLHDFVTELKKNGFDVYTSSKDNGYSYCFFVKDDKIGYVESDYFFGLNFSTVHKPCQAFGTGFGLNRAVTEPKIENALQCFMVCPDTYRNYKGVETIKKYSDWAEYISKNTILSYRKI